jgi:hypothetical protein
MRIGFCWCVKVLQALPLAVGAQEAGPVHREPRHRLVLDSVRFRVLDIQIPAGDTTQYHVHDTAILYVIVNPSPTAAQVLGREWSAGPGSRPLATTGDVFLDSTYAREALTHRVTNAGENGSGFWRSRPPDRSPHPAPTGRPFCLASANDDRPGFTNHAHRYRPGPQQRGSCRSATSHTEI